MSRSSARMWMLGMLAVPLTLTWAACGDGGVGDGSLDEPGSASENQRVSKRQGVLATASEEGVDVATVSTGGSGGAPGGAGGAGDAAGGAGGETMGGAAGAGGSSAVEEAPIVAKVIKTKLLIADIIYAKQIKMGVARIEELNESKQEDRYERSKGASDIKQATVRAKVVYAEDIEADEVQANQLYAQSIQYF